VGEVEPLDEVAAIEKAGGGIQGAGHEADDDPAMTPPKAKSPAVISSANGRITWSSQHQI
jgi:hypothetical protein